MDEQRPMMEDGRPADAIIPGPPHAPPLFPQSPSRRPGPPPPRGPFGFAFLAWLVIIAATIGVLAYTYLGARSAPEDLDDTVATTLFRIQARYLVGASEMYGQGALLLGQSQQLDVGSVEQRQRFVILAAELAGLDAARDRLARLEDDIAEARERTEDDKKPFELSDEQAEVQRILSELYAADQTDAGSSSEGAGEPNIDALSGSERELLVKQLGWTGELALVPRGAVPADRRAEVIESARRTFITVFTIAILGGLAGLAGLVGLIIAIIFVALRRLTSGVRRSLYHHGIYAETFAIWMIVFWGSITLLSELFPGSLIASFAAFVISLVALAWPVLRGIPFRQVRADIGWVGGRLGAGEIAMAAAGYAMTLPLLALGILLTVVLMMVQTALAGEPAPFEPAGGPAHPIISDIAAGGVWLVLQVLLIGCVAAPIVEETFFRGVLYRHLRDATRHLGPALSIAIGTLVNAFLFAVIHPQGWVAVPALMSLAIGFTLMREWRGTLLVPMLMHGLSNGIVLGMLTLILSY
jgi:membrane protease YdiL (CAAX protease family)